MNLHYDPIPQLLSTGNDPALIYFVRRDLLGIETPPPTTLWQLTEPQRLLDRQEADGSWRYPGGDPATTPGSNYALLQTYRHLGILVEMYGFDSSHPALAKAVAYIFSCQTEEGDVRGILSNQYMPYYHGAILELVIKAGVAGDERVTAGMAWLLAMRQMDGGWIVPVQALPAREKTRDMWQGPSVPPVRERPSSHLATGMVLRAFAAHPRYRCHPDVLAAATLLKDRFFKADKYNDRKGSAYWLKFQYPFWWTNLLTALDTLARLGFTPIDPQIQRGLQWFVAHQSPDGLWDTGYGAGARAQPARGWVALAILRVLRQYAMV